MSVMRSAVGTIKYELVLLIRQSKLAQLIWRRRMSTADRSLTTRRCTGSGQSFSPLDGTRIFISTTFLPLAY